MQRIQIFVPVSWFAYSSDQTMEQPAIVAWVTLLLKWRFLYWLCVSPLRLTFACPRRLELGAVLPPLLVLDCLYQRNARDPKLQISFQLSHGPWLFACCDPPAEEVDTIASSRHRTEIDGDQCLRDSIVSDRSFYAQAFTST